MLAFAKCGVPLKIWWESFWECHFWRIYDICVFFKHMGENKIIKHQKCGCYENITSGIVGRPWPSLKLTNRPWKWKVGKLLAFWGRLKDSLLYAEIYAQSTFSLGSSRWGGASFVAIDFKKRVIQKCRCVVFFLRLNGAWESCLSALFLKAHTRIKYTPWELTPSFFRGKLAVKLPGVYGNMLRIFLV